MILVYTSTEKADIVEYYIICSKCTVQHVCHVPMPAKKSNNVKRLDLIMSKILEIYACAHCGSYSMRPCVEGEARTDLGEDENCNKGCLH